MRLCPSAFPVCPYLRTHVCFCVHLYKHRICAFTSVLGLPVRHRGVVPMPPSPWSQLLALAVRSPEGARPARSPVCCLSSSGGDLGPSA